MEEQWKSVIGWEGIYYISSLGRVRKGDKLIKASPNKNRHGYCYVNLAVKEKRKNSLLHRVVATHFIPNPEDKPCVNHLDFDVSNNKASNLEWATHKENSEHTVRAGRTARLYGEQSGNSKLTLETVRAIREEIANGKGNTETAKKFDTNYSNIAHIRRGSRWQHVA